MINDPAVTDYLSALEPEPDPLLLEMRQHGERDHIPIVFDVTGGLLEVLAAATGAKRAVEVGTAIGVSTLHLSRGGAHVTSFEVDPERHAAAREYLKRGGFEPDLRLQDATAGLAELEDGSFDLAFIDGPKAGYETHLDEAVRLLRSGGLLLVDNVLMGGGAATGEPVQPVGPGVGRPDPRLQPAHQGSRRPARDLPRGRRRRGHGGAAIRSKPH